MGRVTARRPAVRLDEQRRSHRPDTLVVEEPVELRVAGGTGTVTMRTPGDDFELAAGFLASAGVVGRTDDIAEMRYCAGVDEDGTNTYNVLDISLTDGALSVGTSPEGALPSGSAAERSAPTTGSCGVGGRSHIDAAQARAAYDVATDPVTLSSDTLAGLPETARRVRRVFARTGSSHAAGVFTAAGNLVCLREDVDCHNAVDKVVGWALRERRIPLRGHVLFVTDRASFELTQKALLAGMPALTAACAPTSLAVDLASRHGMTLIGCLRATRMNVYTGAHRLVEQGHATP